MGFEIDAGTKNAEFFNSNRSIDLILGPIGSGKTKTCCLRLMRHAFEQDQSPLTGKRMTRFAIVRNSYPDLKRSTIRTWLETFPEEIWGKFIYGATLGHKIIFNDVESQFDFISLDKPEDVRKLRSTEYTGIFFNELPFIEKELFDEADSRLRYPPTVHCQIQPGGTKPEPKWRGVIADGNAPDEDHWLAAMTGQIDRPIGLSFEEGAKYEWPAEWGLYMQAPALIEKYDGRGILTSYDLNPLAENLRNLPPDYYMGMLRGKSKAWIDSRLMNRVALVVDGQPVWPMFRREYHVSREPLRPVAGHDVVVSLDFGRIHPAALFAQEISGRIYVQYEILGFNEPASQFAPKVKRFLEQNYRGSTVRFTGDPKGRDKGQSTADSSYDIFRFHGMHVSPAPVKMNNIETRTEAVAYALNDNPSGVNRLVISPLARTLIVGMSGRYFLTREETGELKPDKGKYSHLCDALQYLCVYLGEGRRMIGLEATGIARPARLMGRPRTLRRVIAL